jgi:hypothetical protein
MHLGANMVLYQAEYFSIAIGDTLHILAIVLVLL